MALIIQKFGGSSLANIECLQRVADIIARSRADGHQVVVVVSAMEGETDRLISLAKSAVASPHPRDYDALVSTGEQVSSSLLSMILNSRGCSARSFTGRQAGILTNSHHRKAKIEQINTEALLAEVTNGIVPVVAGFQGIDALGHITTIGRGGSDMTAVALASALQADECQIYTDVEGVFTSDPRIVKAARRLDEITFEEMLELSRLGAKVLQIRAVELANRSNVPLRVLSTFQDGPGTLITHTQHQSEPFVSGIAFDRKQAKLSVLGIPNAPNVKQHILDELLRVSIDVDMVIENGFKPDDPQIDFSFTVHIDDYLETKSITDQVAKQLQANQVIGDDSIAKLSIVGVGMTSHASVASKMLHALAEEGINPHLITSSEVTISTVIDEKYIELGARALHSAFGLDGAHSI